MKSITETLGRPFLVGLAGAAGAATGQFLVSMAIRSLTKETTPAAAAPAPKGKVDFKALAAHMDGELAKLHVETDKQMVGLLTEVEASLTVLESYAARKQAQWTGSEGLDLDVGVARGRHTSVMLSALPMAEAA